MSSSSHILTMFILGHKGRSSSSLSSQWPGTQPQVRDLALNPSQDHVHTHHPLYCCLLMCVYAPESSPTHSSEPFPSLAPLSTQVGRDVVSAEESYGSCSPKDLAQCLPGSYRPGPSTASHCCSRAGLRPTFHYCEPTLLSLVLLLQWFQSEFLFAMSPTSLAWFQRSCSKGFGGNWGRLNLK